MSSLLPTSRWPEDCEAGNENAPLLFDEATARHIGEKLRGAFSDITQAPIPDELMELIDAIARRQQDLGGPQ